MKPLLTLALVFALFSPRPLTALDAETQIKAVLTTQTEAWNRGDLPTFVTTYADDCIFVAKPITQGTAQLLAHYQKAYPNHAAMGHLTFSDMDIHLVDKDVAIVTAEFHLAREAAAGGPKSGIFSLVLHRKNGLWKIALDHTS